MGRDSAKLRLLIVYFATEDASEVQKVAQELTKRLRSAQVKIGSANSRSEASFFSRIKLHGESLMTVTVKTEQLAEAIQIIQFGGSRSVFIFASISALALSNDHCAVSSMPVEWKQLDGQLRSFEEELNDSSEYLRESIKVGHPASPAAQWVVDNAYLAAFALSEVRLELNKIYRKLSAAELARLWTLSNDFLTRFEARISEDDLAEFLDESQSSSALSSLQLWAFPLFLKTLLISRAVSVACRCRRIQHLRELAFLWADRLSQSAKQDKSHLASALAILRSQQFVQDPTFSVALAEQLQDQETALRSWWSADSIDQLGDLVQQENARESREGIEAAATFAALRTVPKLDVKTIFDRVSRLERILRQDPAGVYPLSDFSTRDFARQRIARIASQSSLDEAAVAELALDCARQAAASPQDQVLYFAIGQGSHELEARAKSKPSLRQSALRFIQKHNFGVYVFAILALTALMTAASVLVAREAGLNNWLLLAILGALSIFPISELMTQLVQTLVVTSFPPRPSPKLDYRDGIPDESRTIVVIPMMFTSETGIRASWEKLEVRFLANRQNNLTFTLLGDFVDAEQQRLPEDEVLLEVATKGLAELEAKYGPNQFAFFYRERQWSDSESKWIGWERKRGKLEELNSYLTGGPSSLILKGSIGPAPRYVITLDADTKLPPHAALRLIEAISHPLNRVTIDPVTGVRRDGYTIFQPRVSIALSGANASRFTRIFSDAHGTDPYCTVVSDAQQDLFGDGIFHGKAIYELRPFHQMLQGRFPAETILSHDLIEGAHVGVRFASDIEILEDIPLDYAGFVTRQHRWIRGDWQIWEWATGRVPKPGGGSTANPLSPLNRWRVADNLRRSISPAASFFLLIFGWLFSLSPSVWTMVFALGVGIPALAPILERWSRQLDGTVYGWRGALDDAKRATVMLTFLPHQAWVALDAIGRALYRKQVSKRHLLQWLTAESANEESSSVQQQVKKQVVAASLGSVLLFIVLSQLGTLPVAAPILVLWIAAPFLLKWLQMPLDTSDNPSLEPNEELEIRSLARLTWRYFDDLVSDQTHWLPPDNTQLALRIEVAQRTSPTNIGLWLNSALAAYDFGFLTPTEFLVRTRRTLDTMDRMERYEGHFLNWYSTATLDPLEPKYVSTVDSGNFIASLWLFAGGCEEVADAAIIPERCFSGLRDAVRIIANQSADDPALKFALQQMTDSLSSSSGIASALSQLRLMEFHARSLKESTRWSTQAEDNLAYWISKLSAEVQAWVKEADSYLRWMDILMRPSDESVRSLGAEVVEARKRLAMERPTLKSLARGMSTDLRRIIESDKPEEKPELRNWISLIRTEFYASRQRAVAALDEYASLAHRANQCATEIDMGFLYDRQRRLFGIGYTVGHPRTFNSHYDLLASECRLASLVSIAKRDVPLEHWFVLSRPWINSPGRQAMLSWSGTMFEYLMPVLFLEPFQNSLLQEACSRAVDAQMEFSHPKDAVWGISESAYGALDSNQIYQYRAFGVPSLALNPAVDAGPVFAPYASALALMIRPVEALENLRRLANLGLMGKMGFYEAFDYTQAPKKGEKPGIVIFAYMAHHQAMSLLAFSNAVGSLPTQQVRFHRDPRVKAVESLLFERIPIAAIPAPELRPQAVPEPSTAVQDRHWAEPPHPPKVFVASSGQYSLMVSSNGSSCGQWKGISLNRWRPDLALDDSGHFIWLKDRRSGQRWTISHPFCSDSEQSLATFSSERAEFLLKDDDLEAKLEIAVASDAQGEIRRLTISNRSLRTRRLELTVYVELALAPLVADAAHPAFSKLFVQTSLHEPGFLLARRRPRSPEETELWAALVLGGFDGRIEFETDRLQFLGRNNEPHQAAAFRAPLSGSTGTVLDPVFALRFAFDIDARDQREFSLATLVGSSKEQLLEDGARLRHRESIARSMEMAWFRAQLEFRHLRIDSAAAHRYQELASHLIYPSSPLRPGVEASSQLGQPELWKFGISGDLPIVLVNITDESGVPLLRDLLLAKAFLRIRGLELDLVILLKEQTSYEAPLRKIATRLIHAHLADSNLSGAGKAHLLDFNSLSALERDFLQETAHLILNSALGPLPRQLFGRKVQTSTSSAPIWDASPTPVFDPLPPTGIALDNGLGAFLTDGREYLIELGPNQRPAVPWANVIANETFGCLLTEAGMGCTWATNSQMNRLTPWHNDPVLDRSSEIIYLRNEDTGTFWSCTPQPNSIAAPARVIHGQGYSRYELSQSGIASQLTVFCAADEPLKLMQLEITNRTPSAKRLSITHFAEWVLGTSREGQQTKIRTWLDPQSSTIVAVQNWNETFAGRLAFCASSLPISSFTTNRTQFLGFNGSYAHPLGMKKPDLESGLGVAMDPCSVIRGTFELKPGEKKVVVLLLGQAETLEEVRRLKIHYAHADSALVELKQVRQQWDHFLGAIQVRTPEPSIDAMLNRWLLYQGLSCRFWGRTALYQSGGALGFRDQLQDCLAFIYSRPELARRHILTAATHQFPEGDVLHWWHPISGIGVRTLCSDDLLWLPWVLSRYLDITGDLAILDEQVAFVQGPLLAAGEHETMLKVETAPNTATLLEHCLLAFRHAAKSGPHGLPLIGNGDWNDGMNRIGIEGRGESVWLAWFYSDAVRRWESYSRHMPAPVWTEIRNVASGFARNAEAHAWDGAWYLRAFFDDGAPVGSQASTEARIDSLPQSWAVLSHAGHPERSQQSVEAAYLHLVKPADGLVLLFTPPFDHSAHHPGYIMGYPPGIRENGGQYTHAALWLAQAFAELNQGDKAVQLLQISNPAARTATPQGLSRYAGEPYAVAADISSTPGRVGKAGWTWYTGSAGWMYRIWIESVFGFTLQKNQASFRPSLPCHWRQCELHYRHGTSLYRFILKRHPLVEDPSRTLVVHEGTMSKALDLVDDGQTYEIIIAIEPVKVPLLPLASLQAT